MRRITSSPSKSGSIMSSTMASGLAPGHLDGLPARGCSGNLPAFVAHGHGQQLGQAGFIVDREDPDRGSVGSGEGCCGCIGANHAPSLTPHLGKALCAGCGFPVNLVAGFGVRSHSCARSGALRELVPSSSAVGLFRRNRRSMETAPPPMTNNSRPSRPRATLYS